MLDYQRNEVPKDAFVRLMRGIIGDNMLRLAVLKMQAKVLKFNTFDFFYE